MGGEIAEIRAVVAWTTDYPSDSNARAVYSWYKLGKSIFRSVHVTIPITAKPFNASFICRNVVRGLAALSANASYIYGRDRSPF